MLYIAKQNPNQKRNQDYNINKSIKYYADKLHKHGVYASRKRKQDHIPYTWIKRKWWALEDLNF